MLDPHAQALIDFCRDHQVPAFSDLTPPQARQAYLQGKALTQPDPEPVAGIENFSIPGGQRGVEVPVRLYRPAATAGAVPLTLYLHGGGWVIGDLDTHDTLCRQVANRAHCAVLAIDYRLAPEHRFPAAVDDALAVLRWVLAYGTTLGLDPTRLAVAGDSAGGNLAAVLALAHRDLVRAQAGLAPLRLQVLLYPVTQLQERTESWSRWGEGYLLSQADLAWFQAHYLGADATPAPDWRHSPLRATDHSQLAPALVITAGFDPLRDDGSRYAQCLAAAGNPVSLVCFERQVHGFVLMGRLLPEAETAVTLVAARLHSALA